MRKPSTAEDFSYGEFEDELSEIQGLSMAVEMIVRDEIELDKQEVETITKLTMMINDRVDKLIRKISKKDVEAEAA
jgi:hypothetical protein